MENNMAGLFEDLLKIKECLKDIRNALIEKGAKVKGIDTYAEAIRNLETK